jgi:hypothetical protein
MVPMSAATWEQLSAGSIFGSAESTMELVSPGRMKTGPVQRSIKSIKGPNQMKKWPGGNQKKKKTAWQATKVPANLEQATRKAENAPANYRCGGMDRSRRNGTMASCQVMIALATLWSVGT